MIASLLVLLLLCFCPLIQTKGTTDLPELEIIEAVFRFQIEHCYQDRSPKLYFLSYKDNDPSEALMEMFKNSDPPVRRRSQMFRFKDKDSGQRGTLLAIRKINRRSNSVFEVKGTCGASPLDAYSYEYHVVQKDRKWMIKKHKLTGIS